MAPTTPTPSPAKVCIVCKQDCSARPRNKDEQGRYTCQDCAKKLATAGASRTGSDAATPPKPVVKSASPGGAPPVAAGARQAAARGADDGLYKLAADPLPAYMFEEKPVEVGADQEMCQSCGNLMKKAHVICIKCGHNKQNHKTLHTVLKRPEVVKEARARQVTMGETLDSMYVIGPIGVVALGLIVWMVAGAQDKSNDFVVAYAAAGLFSLVAGIICLIAAFMSGLVEGLLYLLLPFYSLYWILARCESAFIKALYWSSVLVSVTSFVTGFRGFQGA